VQVRYFDQQAREVSATELRNELSARQGLMGSFWLGEGPHLAIMVREDSACVHYFPHAEHPGFYAIGPVQDWDGRESFVADNREPIEVPVSMVISWEAAVTAAEEFCQAQSLPASLNWSEL
jgi:hypothetical protein